MAYNPVNQLDVMALPRVDAGAAYLLPSCPFGQSQNCVPDTSGVGGTLGGGRWPHQTLRLGSGEIIINNARGGEVGAEFPWCRLFGDRLTALRGVGRWTNTEYGVQSFALVI